MSNSNILQLETDQHQKGWIKCHLGRYILVKKVYNSFLNYCTHDSNNYQLSSKYLAINYHENI